MTQTDPSKEVRVLVKSTKRGYVTGQSLEGPVTFTVNRELAYVFQTLESLGAFVRDFEYIPHEGLTTEELYPE
ncbi:MAG: hypothetical protein QOH70_2826 [Blastocatellia bacterium]|jgi:hypothetical protein|nr:hypothetical protein [Blastocatellia bacterium]